MQMYALSYFVLYFDAVYLKKQSSPTKCIVTTWKIVLFRWPKKRTHKLRPLVPNGWGHATGKWPALALSLGGPRTQPSCMLHYISIIDSYRSLAKKGPVSNICPPPPYFALISCKGLKFTLKSAHLVDLARWTFLLKTHRTSSYLKTSRAFDILIRSGKPKSVG